MIKKQKMKNKWNQGEKVEVIASHFPIICNAFVIHILCVSSFDDALFHGGISKIVELSSSQILLLKDNTQDIK